MHSMRLLVVSAGLILLVGCSAMGVVATSDPDVKLNDAYNLYARLDRPLPAETLISQAIEIYKNQNNFIGLGNAYAEYGDLLSSPSLAKWGFKNMSFHDKTVNFDNRLSKSKEYYNKSLEAYQEAKKQALDAEQYDAVTNIYLQMAKAYYYGFSDIKSTCESFDKSFEAYTENIRRNPTAKPIAIGYNSFPELIAARKKNVGCE